MKTNVIILFLTYQVVAGEVLSVRIYRASHGQDAVLPCGPDKVFLDGPDSFVVWLIDDEIIQKYPDVYYKRPLVLDHKFKRECTGLDCPDNTALLIENVSDEDAGLYQCRIHFQASPAIDYAIEVIVVGSPGQPKIYNDTGPQLNGAIGPLHLGSNLTLVCEVSEEHVESRVWWERNGVRMNTSSVEPGVLTQEIRLTNISRAELDAHYVCLSQNADVTEPLYTSIVMKMILLPVSVEIRLNDNVRFEADEPRVVDCVIVGCVPPPTVTWFLGGVPLKSSSHKEHNDGNFTVSSLTLTISLKKKQETLMCRAQNYFYPDKSFESKINLYIGFKPKCVSNGELPKFGVVDGESETAACLVDAYPAPHHFVWYFDFTGPYYTYPSPVPGKPHRFSSMFDWTHSNNDHVNSMMLVCAAVNDFGQQEVPCKFGVIKGGSPAQPKCELRAQYPKTLIVNCSETWDGGRLSTMHLDIHNGHDKVIDKYTNENGHFRLREQKEDNITAVVYASSARGRSKPLIMKLPNLTNNFSKTVGPPPKTNHLKLWQGVVFVIIITVGFLIIVQCFHIILNKVNGKGDSTRNNGVFHREPEFPTIEDRSFTNITVNQRALHPPSYVRAQSPSGGSCRVMVGCQGNASIAPDCARQTFFV